MPPMTERVGDLDAIEDAFLQQWANFGIGPGGTFHDEGDLVWTEAPVPQLPYNAVLRARLGDDPDDRIDALLEGFHQRGVQFLWPLMPSSSPADLGERLRARGLSLVETSTGMALDLGTWNAPAAPPSEGPIVYREVLDEEGMRAYERLIVDYWELDEASAGYVLGINRWGAEDPERGSRWVAYRDEVPVGKIYLSWLGPADTAAVFGVYVKPEARGHSVASHLTALTLERARERGRRRAVLHSSEMGRNLYERLGFVARCEIPVYATTPLHGLQPS